MHRALTSLIALAWLTGAAAPGARLAWVRLPGAESCADPATVEAGVTKRLGYDPFTRDPERRVEAIVERVEGKWQARLWWTEPGPQATENTPDSVRVERTIATDAETCDGLGPAAALALAIAIDPESALRAPGMPPEEPPKPAPIVEEVKPDPRAWAKRPVASVRAIGANGTVPGTIAPGVAMSVGGGLDGPVTWAAGAIALPMQRTDAFGFAVIGATAEACTGGVPLERIAIRACARAMGGVLEAFVFPSEDVRSVAPGQYPWLAGAAAVRATALVVGPVIVEAEVAAIVPITRQAFLMRGVAEPVFQEASIGLQAALGAGILFE